MFYLEIILNCFQDIPETIQFLLNVKEPDFASTYYIFYSFDVPKQKKLKVEAALQKAKASGDVISFRFSAAPLK